MAGLDSSLPPLLSDEPGLRRSLDVAPVRHPILEAPAGSGIDALEPDFLAMLEHELRTPLQLVLNYQEAFEDLLASLPDGEDKAAAADGLRAGYERLRGSVQDVMEIARLLKGPEASPFASFCLTDLAAEVVEIFRPRFEAQHVLLTLQRSARASEAWGHEQRIADALTRLLEIALRSAPRGSRVSIWPIFLPGYSGLVIRDDGASLPSIEEWMSQEMLSAGNRGQASSFKASGLGLVICRAIIAAHDGRFGVREQPGGGHLMWFVLPTRER
jgi:signal transduction histidine kinase